jgi:hypothetical protein
MGFILVEFSPEQLKQVRQLSTTEGFAEAFHQNLATSKTFIEAYEVTERAHECLFGERKYSCYQSFQVCVKRISNKV